MVIPFTTTFMPIITISSQMLTLCIMLTVHAMPQLFTRVTSLRGMKILPSAYTYNFHPNNVHSTHFSPFTEQVCLWLSFGRCWFEHQANICYSDWRRHGLLQSLQRDAGVTPQMKKKSFAVCHPFIVMPFETIHIIQPETLTKYLNKQNPSLLSD